MVELRKRKNNRDDIKFYSLSFLILIMYLLLILNINNI